MVSWEVVFLVEIKIYTLGQDFLLSMAIDSRTKKLRESKFWPRIREK